MAPLPLCQNGYLTYTCHKSVNPPPATWMMSFMSWSMTNKINRFLKTLKMCFSGICLTQWETIQNCTALHNKLYWTNLFSGWDNIFWKATRERRLSEFNIRPYFFQNCSAADTASVFKITTHIFLDIQKSWNVPS